MVSGGRFDSLFFGSCKEDLQGCLQSAPAVNPHLLRVSDATVNIREIAKLLTSS